MRKAIDWFALVVGAALALYGARWMWTGWDIVQAERGWAAVIAGSVMLSGGLIVATLAWMTMRLTSLTAPRRRRQEAPAPQPGAQQESAPVARPEIADAGMAAAGPAGADIARPPFKPAMRPEIAVPASIAIGAAAGAAGGLVLPRRAADDEIVADTPAEDTPPLQPPSPPTVGELLRMSEDRAARESHEKIFEEPEPAPAPPLAEPLSPEPLEEPDDEPFEEKPAAAQPPAAPPVEPAPVVDEEPEAPPAPPEPLRLPEPPAASADEPVYDDWLERTAREFDRELGRDGVRDIAPKDEPPPEPAPPPKAEPAVVGRYASGDTNYLMFADGSIEAQTPEGIMRFASLTELKRFVEKRN